MRNKKNPATSGTPPDKPYIIEIINDSGGKAIFEKLNSLSDPEREAYVKELESRWETEYPKYPATWVQLFAEILPKYVKKRFAGNLDLLEKEMEGATIQHQGQQIAKLVKESELYKFNQKYRNDIDVTDNGIVVMFQQWLKIQKDYLNEMGNTPDPPAPDQEPKQIKNFIAHLTMDERKKQPFADQIKMKFPAIKGTKLGMLLGAMEAKGWICIGTRTELYYSIRQFFGWNICSDAMLNRVMSNLPCKTKEIQQYQTIIENIYNSIV